jgi:cold shock CspA family protein
VSPLKKFTGIVRMIKRDKLFGFIEGMDGVQYFFHRSSAPRWDELEVGTPVRFERLEAAKGPRAEHVEPD